MNRILRFVTMALAAALLLPGPLSASGRGNQEQQEQTLLPRRFVADTTRPTLVMLTAVWCQPCLMMKQEVMKDQTVAAVLGRRNVVILDIDTFDGAVVAERFRSIGYQRAVPFFALFNAAQDSVSVMMGGCDAQQFINFIERFPAPADAAASDDYLKSLDGEVEEPLPEWQPEISMSGNLSFLSGDDAQKSAPLPGWGLSAGVRRNFSDVSALCAGAALTATGGKAPGLADNGRLRRYMIQVPVEYERRLCGFGPKASLRARAGIWGGYIFNEKLPDTGTTVSIAAETRSLAVTLGWNRGLLEHSGAGIGSGYSNTIFLGVRVHL